MSLILICGLICLVYSFVLFDRLIRVEYECHHEAWIADGRPSGFFYFPLASSFNGANRGKWLSLKWLFSAPLWIRRSRVYNFWLVQMRISTLIWYAALGLQLVMK
jgi:hypothetical protein